MMLLQSQLPPGADCSPVQLLRLYSSAENLLFFSKTAGTGGVMVLGKLPVPECPTNLDNRGTRAYCACSRCGRGLFGHFFSSISP